ncbi:MAG: TetR/AcrR family transcriptional regulator [Microbacteriaceae bacterium]
MPRLVDHVERRAEIVRATWRIIAEQGIEATTMRELAHQLGLANGSVTHYFPNKKAILTAAFQHVFDATNARYAAAAAARDLHGLAALRAFLLETLPIDEERLLEARIVIPFLEYAAIEEDLATLFRSMMEQWQDRFTGLLEDARERGELAADVDVCAASDALLHAVTGVQAIGVLLPETARAQRMVGMLDALLQMLR